MPYSTLDNVSKEAVTKYGKKLVDGLKKLDNYDYTSLKNRLMSKEFFPEDKADYLLAAYQRFFSLRFVADSPISPTREIDNIWHLHILDTKEYEKFCNEVFGKFVHHIPREVAATKPVPKDRTHELALELYGDKLTPADCCNDGGCQNGRDCGVSTG